jgi:hypothetical protein
MRKTLDEITEVFEPAVLSDGKVHMFYSIHQGGDLHKLEQMIFDQKRWAKYHSHQGD